MSFSQEMKDFLGAYKTGQSINASRTDQEYKSAQTERTQKTTERENDPETLKTAAEIERAKLDKIRDSMKSSAAARGVSNTRQQLLQEQYRQMRGQGQAGSGLLPPSGAIQPTMSPNGQPLPASQGVLPVGPSTMDTGEDLYAAGGLVEDDEESEFTPDNEATEGEGALPMTAAPVAAPAPAPVPAPANAPTDVSARSREPRVPKGLEGVISPALVADATKAGMTFLARESGLATAGAVRSPRAVAAARAIAQGQGGLSEDEMTAARKVVDPEGKLTESQRNMAALGSVYQFWANKGEPQKAEKVAAQMLQYYRNASQRYAAIAAKAAEGGNVDLATRAALKAYANVPDGNDLELLPNPDGGIMYAITGPNGDMITKGIATPQQLAASAMGLATGGFDKAILSAAGAREIPKEAVKTSGRAQTASDRAKEAETVGGEIEKLKTAWQAKNKDAPVDDEVWSEVGNAAQHIYQQNPKATASEVARAAHALLVPGKDAEKAPFKVKPGEEGQPNIVDFGGRMKVSLDDEQLDAIMNARAARVKVASDKAWADAEKENTPGFMDKAAGAVGTIASGVSKLPTPPQAAAGAVKGAFNAAVGVLDKIYGEHIPAGVKQAVKAAVEVGTGAADDAASATASRFRNQGAIPMDEADRPL